MDSYQYPLSDYSCVNPLITYRVPAGNMSCARVSMRHNNTGIWLNQIVSTSLTLSWRLMHIYRHDSGRGVSDLLEFNGVTWDIFSLNRRSPDSHLCDSGLCTLRISEGKSKGVQEPGLHHKNNKILLFIAVCSLYFLSLFLEWIV